MLLPHLSTLSNLSPFFANFQHINTLLVLLRDNDRTPCDGFARLGVTLRDMVWDRKWFLMRCSSSASLAEVVRADR